MTRRSRISIASIILAVPLAIAALWAVSGFERLTKPFKNVAELAHDDLFGDSSPHFVQKPGPIFGYFIGLDAVVIAIVSALLILTAWWIVARASRRKFRLNTSQGTSA